MTVVAKPGPDVTLELDANGNLGIRGGDGDSCILVHRLDPTTVDVTGCDSTTVGMAESAVITGATGNLRLGDLKGNDYIKVTQEPGAAWPGSILIDAGPGKDTVVVEGVTVAQNVAMATSSGFDTVVVEGVTARANLLIDTDTGSDRVAIVDSEIRRQTWIAMGSGRDLVELRTSILRGRTRVDLGTGDDSPGPIGEAGGLCLAGATFASVDVALLGGPAQDASAVESVTLPNGVGLADVLIDFEESVTNCGDLGT